MEGKFFGGEREIFINAHDIFNYDILMRLWVDGFIILRGNVSKNILWAAIIFRELVEKFPFYGVEGKNEKFYDATLMTLWVWKIISKTSREFKIWIKDNCEKLLSLQARK